jgi:spore coat-associated protein N
MTIKKKLGLGVASAALGLSLIGGGTWAAFNDTATINNHFASGELDLAVGKSGQKPISFDLKNMKPGDNVQRIFKLNNAGTLAIKEVLLDVTTANFVDGGDASTLTDYLSQFVITFAQVDGEQDTGWPLKTIVETGQTLTLADLVAGPATYGPKIKDIYQGAGNKINLAPLVVAPGEDAERGIPVTPTDSDEVFIQISYNNDLTKDANNEYVQNKYMNDSVDFFFNLEATQWDGVHVDSHIGNGTVNNGVQGSADGTTMPNPRTSGPAKHSQETTEVNPD